jgi:adenine-specific DNA-methyltransferase
MSMKLDYVYHGDCLELLKGLPKACLDLVVSSPPYNIGKEYESKQALQSYLAEQRTVLKESIRCLKPTGSIFWQVGSYADSGVIIPLDIRFFPMLEDLGMIPRNRIVWIRQHGLHAQRKFSCRHETILWFAKSKNSKFNLDAVRVPQKYQNKKAHRGEKKGELSCNPLGKNPGDIWIFQNVKHNHEEQTIHPCQFPEDLITRVVLATTDEGDVVFDPYMGVGTVAVVAKDHNRRFLGAETDDAYIDIARRRIECKPDKSGSFPNLKTLRRFLLESGERPEKYRFDVQVGKVASTCEKSRRFSEQHHLESLEERLTYEEDAFVARVNSLPAPVNPHEQHLPKPSKKRAPATPLFSGFE